MVDTGRRLVETAIWKYPVEGRVKVRGVNLEGDRQADLTVHGGENKAVYAYAIEETRLWEEELGRELGAGAFGENLTTEGVDVSGAVLGERWRVGTTLLEVVQPRLPCFKLGLKMEDPTFLKTFAQASRPGAYLKIIEEGDLGAGDRDRGRPRRAPRPRRQRAARLRRDAGRPQPDPARRRGAAADRHAARADGGTGGMSARPSQEERGRRFAALHEEGCFLIPNPWDAGTARVLESLGFEALATTSSGFAFTLGREDGGVTLDEVVGHVAALAAASDLPISVDLENGYGAAPEHAARAIEAVAAVGAVGGSIEDWEEEAGLYEIGAAAERVAAAAEVARELPFPFLLTARAENHIRGNPDLDDTIARLRAYEAAGADVLYAPGLGTVAEIEAVVGAVGKPVNVLARPTLSVAEIAGAGARRISVGGSLAWAAVEAMAEVARRRCAAGDLSGLRGDVAKVRRSWMER